MDDSWIHIAHNRHMALYGVIWHFRLRRAIPSAFLFIGLCVVCLTHFRTVLTRLCRPQLPNLRGVAGFITIKAIKFLELAPNPWRLWTRYWSKPRQLGGCEAVIPKIITSPIINTWRFRLCRAIPSAFLFIGLCVYTSHTFLGCSDAFMQGATSLLARLCYFYHHQSYQNHWKLMLFYLALKFLMTLNEILGHSSPVGPMRAATPSIFTSPIIDTYHF